MEPLNRASLSSYKLSVVAMSLSAVVWPQFAMQSRYLLPSSLFDMFVETVSCIFSHCHQLNQKQYYDLDIE